jgi:DNA adenine methylase
MKKTTLRPPFKCHGGKKYLAKWIIDYFPANYQEMTYLEPFCGGANVLLNKDASKEEIINDLDEDIIILFRIIRDQSIQFIRKVKNIKYKEANFKTALERKEFASPLQHAINEFVLRRMSRGGMKKAFAWSNRERGGQPGEINAWKTVIDLIPEISQRLQNVIVLNKSALQLVKVFNDSDTLIYADPPYLPETRESPDVYKHEMTIDEHMELGDALNAFKGKVLISGYPSRLYAKMYKNWTCEKKSIANHSSQQKVKPVKLELLWRNF